MGTPVCWSSSPAEAFPLLHPPPHPTPLPHPTPTPPQLAVHRAMQLPDVRTAFLSVMASLVAGPVGARFMLAQFAASAARPELEHFTWRTLFRTLVSYCGRWALGRLGAWVEVVERLEGSCYRSKQVSATLFSPPPMATPPHLIPSQKTRYQQIEAEKAAAGIGGVGGIMAVPVSAEDKLMHPGEEKLLVAYLHLLA